MKLNRTAHKLNYIIKTLNYRIQTSASSDPTDCREEEPLANICLNTSYGMLRVKTFTTGMFRQLSPNLLLKDTDRSHNDFYFIFWKLSPLTICCPNKQLKYGRNFLNQMCCQSPGEKVLTDLRRGETTICSPNADNHMTPSESWKTNRTTK